MITSCTTNTRKYNYKSWKPRFWELMDSFILFAYASLVASRTLLQRLLACLNFTLESEDLSFLHKRKKWFLWTMAAAQAAENYGDEWGLTWCFQSGIYASIPAWTHSQIHQQQKHQVQRYPPMEHLSNDQDDHPNQHENSHKLCNEMEHPFVNLMESQ